MEKLTQSKGFRSYVRHLEYTENLYLTWFIAPITLFIVFYYHIAIHGDGGINLLEDPSSPLRSFIGPPLAPGVAIATAALIFYIGPTIVVAAFVGFFEEPRRHHAIATLGFFLLVTCGIVSFGGKYLHHPPFLVTDPPLSFSSATWDVTQFLALHWETILLRVLPLQGFFVAGYFISLWRSAFWSRAWHPPFPLFSVPFGVGIFGVLWWLAVTHTISIFIDASGAKAVAAETITWSNILVDPAIAVNLCHLVAKTAMERIWLDVEPIVVGWELPQVLQSGASCASLYTTAFSLSLIYFFVLFVKPVISVLFTAALVVLPVDPTIWTLTMATSIGTFATLWNKNEDSAFAPHLTALSLVILALVYNGFVA